MVPENFQSPEDFILDLDKQDQCPPDIMADKIIKHYQTQLENPDLPEYIKQICHAYIGNITEYLELSHITSPNLKNALQHFSENVRFMQDKSNANMDVEHEGRCKSLQSAYEKISQIIFMEYVAKNKKIPTKGLLKDIYATRHILYPKHDMRFNPQAFYKLSYKTILDFMENIDSLHEKDNRYELLEISEYNRKVVEKEKLIKYSEDDIIVPEKDFVDYCFEFKNIPHGYRYLAKAYSNLDNIDFSLIESDLMQLKQSNLSDRNSYSNLTIYHKLQNQVQKDIYYKLKDHFELVLTKDFTEKELKDYYSFSLDEFKKAPYLSNYKKDCCEFLSSLEKYDDLDNAVNFANMPLFKTKSFTDQLRQVLTEFNVEKQATLAHQLKELQNTDLDNYNEDFSKARKIIHYSHCCKDYMKNPKSEGYQSFHIRIKTPFGLYEEQIRTNAQHNYAEHGPASHSNSYKPGEKTVFSMFKIPKFFTPKRDASGDIIMPLELGILPFDLCVQKQYGVNFNMFTEGKSFEQFKEQFNTQEEFNEALCDLAGKQIVIQENGFMTNLFKKFFKKVHHKPTINIESQATSLQSQDMIENIPEDIAAYSASSLAIVGAPSTDDTDPHDNR